MGERWLVAGRPKLGAFPDSIPATHIHGMVGARRQYRLCERICVPTSVLYSNHSTAYIVRPSYIIDVIAKGTVRHQYEVLHVSSQKGYFLPLHRLTFVASDTDGSGTSRSERDRNGETPSISYLTTRGAATSTFFLRGKRGFFSQFLPFLCIHIANRYHTRCANNFPLALQTGSSS